MLPGHVRSLKDKTKSAGGDLPLKIPHMGWNQVQQTSVHPLWHGVDDGAFFYFVHSYYVDPASRENVAGTTEYGELFTSAVFRDNIFAVQFHPEKSHRNGLVILENFVNWNGEA